MSSVEIMVRVGALLILGGYLLLRWIRRLRVEPPALTGEAINAAPLCEHLARVRAHHNISSPRRPEESQRRNWLRKMREAVERLGYFQQLRKDSDPSRR